MSSLWSLTKIQLKQLFGRYVYGEKAKKRGLATTIILLALIVAVVWWAMATMNIQFAEQAAATGRQNFILTYGFLISTIFSVFTMIYEVPALFYKSKDYEMLASLPIKNTTVVTAKFITGYVTTLFYNLLFLLPAVVVYFVYSGVSLTGIIFAIFAVIFSPMFVLLVSSILGFVVNLITSKLKHKNVLSTIIMLLFLVAIFGISMANGSGELINIFVGGEIPLAIKIIFPFIYFIQLAIDTGNFLYFLYFVLISLAYLFLSIAVVTVLYKKINSNLISTKTSVRKKPITFKKSSKGLALLKKETKSFFGSTLWTINTIMGPILVVVIAVVFGILTNSSAKEAINLGEDATLVYGTFKMMYFIFVPLIAGMVVSTCASISMEGSRIQILKQLPISFSSVAISKILFSVLLELPFVFVANIIYLCFVPFDIIFVILLFVVSAISILAFSVLGLVINLRFPKLNWKSEAEAVKQSLSLFVSMFVDMIVSAVPMAIFFAVPTLATSVGIVGFELIILAWFVLLLAISLVLIKFFGEKYYNKLS